MTVTHKFWASGPKWPPPPQPPFLIPHNNEKGVTLLRIQAAICLHSYHAKLCNTWRAVGQKLVCTCSCTDHLLSAQIQPKPLPKHLFTSIMQLMHNALRKMQVWNQLLVICLNAPCALLGDIPCISMTRHPDPPRYSNHPTKMPIDWAWAQDSKNILIFRKSGPVKFWSPPPILRPPLDPPPSPDPLRIETFIYQLIALDVRIPNMYFIDTWRQNFWSNTLLSVAAKSFTKCAGK